MRAASAVGADASGRPDLDAVLDAASVGQQRACIISDFPTLTSQGRYRTDGVLNGAWLPRLGRAFALERDALCLDAAKLLKLRAAVIAGLNACRPWMPLDRIRQIVARTNALAPDVVLLPGDFVATHRIAKMSGFVPHDGWAWELAQLAARAGLRCWAITTRGRM